VAVASGDGPIQNVLGNPNDFKALAITSCDILG